MLKGVSESFDDVHMIWDFNWTDVEGASKYNLYIKHKGSKYPLYDGEIQYSSIRIKNYGSYIADRNRLNWKWKVRAFVSDDWCGWSEKRSFDVEPVNTDPPNDE